VERRRAVIVQVLNRDTMSRIVESVLAGSSRIEVLDRGMNRTIFRWRDDNGASVVAKLWNRPDLKGSVRRCLGIDSASHEWRSLVRLDRAGLRVPRPLGRCRVPTNHQAFTEAVIMEDIGDCDDAMDYIKSLISAGEEAKIQSVEQQLIDMTVAILAAGMIDTDHSLVNVLVRNDGELIRMDVEMARWVGVPQIFGGMYGRMLGRLMGSYTFAVQPDDQRVRRFAQQLASQLGPPRRAMRVAQRYLDAMLAEQKARKNIDMNVANVWGA
jgi:hypothetical protein